MGADKGVRQRGAAAPAKAGLPWAGARAGRATRIWSRQGRQAAGYAWGRPRELRRRRPCCSGAARGGGRGGNALAASGALAPPARPAPKAPWHVAHLHRAAADLAEPPSPEVASSARARAMNLPRPGPQSGPRPSHAAPPAGKRLWTSARGRRTAGPNTPLQSQANATAAEPMSDELLPGGREPNKRLRQAAASPRLCLPLPPLALTPRLVAVQRPHPPSVLSLSNQIFQA